MNVLPRPAPSSFLLAMFVAALALAKCEVAAAQEQIIAFATAPQETPRPLTTLDQVDRPALFVGVDDAGRLRFQSPAPDKQTADKQTAAKPAGPVEFGFAQADLVAWGSPPEPTRGVNVLLIDDTILAVDSVTGDSENLQLKAFGLDRSIPLTRVRGIVFRSSGSQAQRDRLFDVVAGSRTGDRDRLTMVSGDETAGTVKSIDRKGVTLETSLGPDVVETARLSYLVFNPALADAAPKDRMRVLVGLRSGSIIVSEPLERADAGKVRLRPTVVAAKGTPWEVSPTEIVFLAVLGGKSVSLSSLEPTGFRHIPYLNRAWPYQANRSVSGTGLRAAGRRYLAGLGMHSTSRISYALDGPMLEGRMNRFAASLAIDDETDGHGSVTFRVFVDGQEKYRSPTIRGGDRPVPIEVPITGGKQLSLVVDFADFADEQDHADWLEARLLP